MPENAEISLDQYSNSINKKFIWELTIWDKNFLELNHISKKMFININTFLANEINKLKDEDGKIKILTTNKSNIFANENKVKILLLIEKLFAYLEAEIPLFNIIMASLLQAIIELQHQ
ncbi:hypothetical protein [Mesomycoplasma lagogenitalium]|uniref:Uncharacterized protein n=1 Tax=Mesomycoplasma lagogenitalium TaxID=171286 RepID=A0ABY8LT61_9BACT|nr:hypothetical protein [Mesomycoplasma lagogenitalium]WGI36426.1 hypothetical protein QEG99_03080 [Mesomycoplasma lagogenitalium]